MRVVVGCVGHLIVAPGRSGSNRGQVLPLTEVVVLLVAESSPVAPDAE